MNRRSTVGLLLLSCVTATISQALSYTSYCNVVGGSDSYSCTVKEVLDETGSAWAKYNSSNTLTGWAEIAITTNPSASDSLQMYAAGFLEGAVSSDLIWANYYNMFVEEYNSKPWSEEISVWFQNNFKYMYAQIEASPEDPYWQHVSLVLTQLDGMIAGYASVNTDSAKNMDLMAFLLMNADADLGDLQPAYNNTVDWNNETQVLAHHLYDTHCSALVKITDSFSEIFVGHTTWGDFYEMLRMFKTYNFSLSTPNTASKIVMFSSYPGTLSSVDDFYQLDTGLVVTETTNGVYNSSLYEKLTYEGVMSWIKAMISNRMAFSGKQWVDIYAKCNTGTGNNQWIVVDQNKLNPGQGLSDEALYILETIPGYVFTEDVTSYLRLGYWPSYNVPFNEYIYNVSGFAAGAVQYGPIFAYENNPRGEIFRREAPQIQTEEQMLVMMRYNKWQTDPLSLQNPGNAISSRFDLETKSDPNNPYMTRMAFGGIDSKVTSTSRTKNMTCWAQSGPTHDNQVPFDFSNPLWVNLSHLLLPSVWNFGWVLMSL